LKIKKRERSYELGLGAAPDTFFDMAIFVKDVMAFILTDIAKDFFDEALFDDLMGSKLGIVCTTTHEKISRMAIWI